MKKSLILGVFVGSCLLMLGGCEKEDSSLCPQLVDFTVACWEEIESRPPADWQIDEWSTSCEINHHTDGCLRCAMEASCTDYLTNSDEVYRACGARCP